METALCAGTAHVWAESESEAVQIERLAVISELERDAEIMAAEHADDFLQLVL